MCIPRLRVHLRVLSAASVLYVRFLLVVVKKN